MKRVYISLAVVLAGLAITAAPKAEAYSDPNPYINFIVQHESGGIPSRTNSIGCYGLMQACVTTTAPFGCNGHCAWETLRQFCPDWATNVSCQLIWFSHYKDSRYGGSWVTAYIFWQKNSWW
jgi:hypothetical protein